MASSHPRILIADDQPDVLEALRLLLTQHSFITELVTSPRAVLERLGAIDWDLLLMDLNYSRDTTSGAEGLQLLSQVRERAPGLPVVVMTAWGNVDLAVEAMREGAKSFVQKPWDNTLLVQILQREVTDGRAARQQSELRAREQQDALLIQRALLPEVLPSSDRLQIVGAWQPALGFGGDWYDALSFGPDRVGLSIADVAGKGLPAALIMSSLQAAVRAFALESASPAAICASVNRLLAGQMIAGRFATFCYVRLDSGRGVLSYVNAGHNPPLLVRASGEVVKLHSTGIVLGVLPNAEFGERELPLVAGDRLALYTDGITEAQGAAGEEYGESRLADALARHRTLDAAALHRAVIEDVTSFAAAGFQDDATLLIAAVGTPGA